MAKIAAFDEERCVLALKKGDEAALGSIINQYTQYVGAIINSIAGDLLSYEDQEEVITDVFFSLWNNAGRVRPGKLKSYLASIARSKTKDALRRRNKEIRLEDDVLVVSASDPERELTADEEAELLRQALDGLPEPDRTIFIRRYYLCQRTRKIADQMQMNENTVRAKLKRGREKLGQILTEGGFFLG